MPIPHAAAGTILLILSGSGAVAIDEGTHARCSAAFAAINRLVMAKGFVCPPTQACQPLSGLKLYAVCIPGKLLDNADEVRRKSGHL